ncbi:hypothetical protein MNAN1_000157 [Malassezia nana]|uniref:AB hydrolase-1 domain-containing protein n=1 Tax=Malassezia nana TaxID=180528 RepID=A0AAF0J0N5_9BASI|nr:hypothetical protein MNAN1_000157 [Malassezia nana]
MLGLIGVARNMLLPRKFRFILEYADGEPNAIVDMIGRSCPSLCGSTAATAAWWLPSGHAQTIWSSIADFSNVDRVEYKRKVIMVPDGGIISIDTAPVSLAEPDMDDTRPTVVILHGLTGGSYESYVRNCVSKLSKPKEEGGHGMRCVVVNYRGCANTPLTSAQLYSACKTTDFSSALLLLTRMFPKSPMIGMGFSLGGAILAKYMGEAGSRTPLIGAVTVGAPLKLDSTSVALESTYLSMVYAYALGSNLEALERKHIDTLALSPDLWDALEKVFRTKIHPDKNRPIAKYELRDPKRGTLRFMDHIITCKVGGLPTPYGDFPFPSAEAYYTHSSPLHLLHRVARPMLALSADDDPVVPISTHQDTIKNIQNSPNVVLAHSRCGGHLGWFAGRSGERWIYQPIGEFVDVLCETFAQQDGKISQGLGTHVLKHMPLVHPNDSPKATERVSDGEMLSLTLKVSQQVRTYQLTQVETDL